MHLSIRVRHRSVMRALFTIYVFMAATDVLGVVHKSSSDTEVSATEIEQLVRQLGSDHFIRREQARAQLAELGLEAFDALHAVMSDPDTEVRMQAEALLRTIQVELARPNDSAEVRRELARFIDANAAAKLDILDRLAALPHDQGRPALCRIIRFHDSDFMGKEAALAFIDVDRPISKERTKRLQSIIHDELKTSKRTAANWLNVYAEHLDDPNSAASKWSEILLAEEELYRETENATQRIVIRDFIEWHEVVMDKLGRREETLDAIHRVIPQFVQRPLDIIQHFDWLMKFEAWKTIDSIAAEHQDAIDLNTLMQYQVAQSFRNRGDEEKANQLANAAFDMTANATVRILMAKEIKKRTQFDWYEKELRTVIDDEDSDDMEILSAKLELAEKYLDWEQYAESASLVGSLIDKAESDKEFAKKLADNAANQLASMRNVAKARLLRGQAEKLDERRKLLEKALLQHDENIDILIELYHLPNNSDTYQEELKLQISRRVQAYQSLIDEETADFRKRGYGSSRSDLASYYNEYAWLVANTVGNYERALEYSKRSLDLQPNYPDYLDTLARCYYANKNYEAAVIHQRAAHRAKPYLGQVYRQLLLFEKVYKEESKNQAEATDADRSETATP